MPCAGKGRRRIFYLDKPVCLPAGREFAILPYQTECSVRLAQPAGAQLEVLEPVTAAENLKLGDRLRVGEIYTLFYREVESGFLFKGEQHSMFELTYVDRGSLHCVVDGNGVELHQGPAHGVRPAAMAYAVYGSGHDGPLPHGQL